MDYLVFFPLQVVANAASKLAVCSSSFKISQNCSRHSKHPAFACKAVMEHFALVCLRGFRRSSGVNVCLFAKFVLAKELECTGKTQCSQNTLEMIVHLALECVLTIFSSLIFIWLILGITCSRACESSKTSP
eukprot:g60028.t1